jgi:hypothetical protein
MGEGKRPFPGGPPQGQDRKTPDSRSTDIERRLDQIMREIDDLRRLIKKK